MLVVDGYKQISMIEILGKKRVWLSINATFAGRRLKIHIRYLLISAHPDDESLAGLLLAYACLQKGNPCHNLVAVRTQEMEATVDNDQIT
jgi:hypothetical protein